MCFTGDTETVAVLLEAGADPNFYSQFENKSLITQACCNGYADIIRLLIKHGADPNVCDKSGASGLWTAVYHGHKDVVKQLVLEFVEKEVPSCGMDRRRYYYQSPKSPLYVAIDKQHLEIALLLIRAGYSIHNEPWLPQRQFFESEEKAELLQELLKLTDTPPSLLIICRNHLHNYLRGHDLPQKVDKLDLPTFLKKYLLYADLQDA